MFLSIILSILNIANSISISPEPTGEPLNVEHKEGYCLVHQQNGPTLGYSPTSGLKIITVDGLAFKDLSGNGRLEPYEDWRLPASQRAADLAKRLTVEEIAGLMLYSSHQPIPQMTGDVYSGKTFEQSGAKPWELTDV